MGSTLSRRSFVRLGLAASAALAFPGCTQGSASQSPLTGSGSSEAKHAPAEKQGHEATEDGTSMGAPKTVTLSSGYEMPTQGLGTYALDYATCISSIHALTTSGGRLIDTAYMYHNEDAVGEGVRTCGVPREELFITTKIYPNQFADPEAAIEQALGKLNAGYIDLMLLHHPGTGDVEAYRAMERAVTAGKIRSLGLSNWYVKELESFLPQVETVPALVQNEIHPYYQEQDVVPYIQGLGIVVEGWYPLGGRGHNAELLADPELTAIAQAHGVSVPQVILRWDRQRNIVVIPGSSNPAHIAEDLNIHGFSLTEEEMARIAALDRAEKHDWY
ncbi:MAG: aldo/keto reductase [Atopobiaceae bacterium]|nr:aldo/keto reductase [Atopobiaceae bacterium]